MDDDINTALHIATKKRDYHQMRFLLEIGADPWVTMDQNGRTPLMIATSNNDYNAFKTIFCSMDESEWRVYLNLKDGDGNTIFHYAQDPKFIELLLNYGADPNGVQQDSSSSS